ncbi:hypothetical protein N665_0143s0007 [Sinapis alba]|nr:hypothetical protein N665_0143s0007 [Sinapis alba]
MSGVMRNQFTVDWGSLIRLTTEDITWNKLELFIVRYMLQSTVHAIWMERNRRRHNEVLTPREVLIKRLDKNMRNRFTILQREENKELAEGMAFLFGTR